MSNLLYAKSFNNQSTLNVDNIQTTTINSITYNTNVNDISGYITSLYKSVGNQSNYLNSLSGSIKKLNSGTFDGTISLKGTSLISNVSGVSTVDLNGFYIRKNSNGSVHFNMTTNSDYSWYSDFGSHRMTLGSSGLTLENGISSQSINSNGYNINCGNLTCDNGALTISPSSGISTLYLDNFYLQKTAVGDITFYTNSDSRMYFYTNNLLRMHLGSAGLNISMPIIAGSNTLSCGNITTSTGTTLNLGNYGGDLGGNGRFAMGDIITFNSGGIRSSFQMTGYGYFYMNMPSSGDRFQMNCYCYANNFSATSDDRLKANESLITDATATLLKIRPEIYDKYSNFDLSGIFIKESGLIAQEVYNIPELRHLVGIPPDASGNLITTQSSNVNDDANYSNWGSTPASLNYNGLIAYLVKSIQELDARIKVLEG